MARTTNFRGLLKMCRAGFGREEACEPIASHSWTAQYRAFDIHIVAELMCIKTCQTEPRMQAACREAVKDHGSSFPMLALP
jgi:hypothetical protein